MVYREAGIYHTTYAQDARLFPIPADRVGVVLLLGAAVGMAPLLGEYWLRGILIPFLVYGLAALGLNLVTGYAGLLSLGQAAFMAVGAYTGAILYGRYGVPVPVSLLAAGAVAAAVGAVAGAPSLRIKGLYLAVATLCAQFLITWTIQRVPWISGGVYATLNIPPVRLGPWVLDSPVEQYYLALGVVVLLTVFALNIVRTRVGRAWQAIREQDVSAAVIGVSLLRYKLLAFAASAFYAGVAGALVVFSWYGAANIEEFNLLNSIRILGMVVIGGMGSVLGSYLGAAFVTLLPIFVSVALHALAKWAGGVVTTDMVANLEHVFFGALIIFFLAVEPLGLAHLWKTVKDYLRLWPFPY
jgi:branched-chain amino acid transport system permease protein